jgi:GTP-binding protein Era
VAELIREKALARVRDELPHSVAVLVEEMGPDPEREDLLVIRAFLFVERASQKPIVLGRGGRSCATSAPGPGPSSRPCSAPRSTST